MNYSVSNEEMEAIAKELGLKITFNSETPGVLNSTTGEIKPLESYFEDFLDVPSKKSIAIGALANMELKMIKPKENEKKLDDFLFFPDNFNFKAG